MKEKDELIHLAIENKIYIVREQKIMLDRDLAELYGMETKQLKRQVNRNIERFPADFMFELTKNEFEIWRCQFGTSNSSDKMGLRHSPYAFTEYGVLMLSSVLNSPRAIQVNIQIMRTFAKIRQMLADNTELQIEIVARFHSRWRARLAKQIKGKIRDQDTNIEIVFKHIDELLAKKENTNKRNKIGFK